MRELDKALSRHFGAGTVEDLMHEHGDPRQALLHYRVFWPSFEVVGGYVILAELVHDLSSRERLLSSLEAGELTVLKGYRWVEVPYIFNARTLDDPDLRTLAELMSLTWLAALKAEHPGRCWRTQVLEPDQTGSDIGVSFEELTHESPT